MQVAENRAVMFVDLLGFASLTEQHALELERIKGDRLLSRHLDTIFASPDNPLTRAFTSFHRSLESTIDLAQMSHSLTAITFSDSAFVATTHLFEVVNMAAYLIQWLLQQRIPARAGIAYGSFPLSDFDRTLPSMVATTPLIFSEPAWSALMQLKSVGLRG